MVIFDWSSPVSPINTNDNNTNYTLVGILDGKSNYTPKMINWVDGYDDSLTTLQTFEVIIANGDIYNWFSLRFTDNIECD